MNRLAPFLLILAWAASPAPAQAPAPVPPVPSPSPAPSPSTLAKAIITAPLSVADGNDIILSSDGSTGNLSWLLISPVAETETLDKDGRHAARFRVASAKPGIYKFALFAAGSTPGSFDAVVAEVAVVSSGPIPSPTPAPAPNPVPPVQPTPAPEPPPTPPPVPGPSPVQQAATAYLAAIGAAFSATAADVRAGTVLPTSFDRALNARMSPAAKALAKAIQTAPDLATALDQVGGVVGGK